MVYSIFDHLGLFIHENFDLHRLWHLTYSFAPPILLVTIRDMWDAMCGKTLRTPKRFAFGVPEQRSSF